MMKTKFLHQSLLIIPIVCIGNGIFAQYFTRIVEGPLVTNASQSTFCTWADFNNDGNEDLFLSNGWAMKQKNMLFLNEGLANDYSFQSVSEGSVVNDVDYSVESSWGDYDNDGDLDLFVANNEYAHSYLYRNNNDSTFTRLTDGDLLNSSDLWYSWTMSWLDFNLDGYLDIFLGDARVTPNYLFKGAGDGTFKRITDEPVSDDSEMNFSYDHAWIDFDNDGDPDILVDNTQNPNYGLDGPSAFYINDGKGNYTVRTSGMILNAPDDPLLRGTWVDYDNDLDWDLVDAGQAIYRNEGPENDYKFTRLTSGEIISGYTDVGGSVWADMDNDGDIDCFVYTISSDYPPVPMVNLLFSNNGDGSFTEIETGDIVTDLTTSLDAAWTDYDNDGDMDLYVCNSSVNSNPNNLFYKNDNANGNSWIKVKLRGTASNACAIGAVVKVKATTADDPVWQIRAIQGPNNLMAHFGLGTATAIDSMVIQWPSGHDTVLTGVAVDQLLTITEEFPTGYLRASFLADTTVGKHELTVHFTDTSVIDPDHPVTSWSWDFNDDGVEDSDLQDPEYTFASAMGEKYTVSLIISNGINRDTLKRTDLIIVYPLDGNQALWGKATASSEELPLFYAQKAIDNDIESRWNSNYFDTEWMKVELDSVYTVGKVIIHWETAYAKEYRIQTSLNDMDWDEVYCTQNGNGDEDIIQFTGKESKFVKMDGFKRGTEWGYSIYEFEIYKSDGITYTPVECEPIEIENIPADSPLVFIYPNQTEDKVTIDFNQVITQPAFIDLIDISGKFHLRTEVQEGTNQTTMDVSELTNGIYILQIRINGLQYNYKIVKH